MQIRSNLLVSLFVVALSVSFVPSGFAATGNITLQTSPSGEREIQKTFDAWLAAVRTGTSDAVMKLYTKDAVLLPTLSPIVANTPALRKAYFDVFTAKKNLKGTVNEEHIRVFGDFAVNSGLYTFTYTEKRKTVKVPARFSYAYRKTDKGWLIIDHHSSKLPTGH